MSYIKVLTRKVHPQRRDKTRRTDAHPQNVSTAEVNKCPFLRTVEKQSRMSHQTDSDLACVLAEIRELREENQKLKESTEVRRYDEALRENQQLKRKLRDLKCGRSDVSTSEADDAESESSFASANSTHDPRRKAKGHKRKTYWCVKCNDSTGDLRRHLNTKLHTNPSSEQYLTVEARNEMLQSSNLTPRMTSSSEGSTPGKQQSSSGVSDTASQCSEGSGRPARKKVPCRDCGTPQASIYRHMRESHGRTKDEIASFEAERKLKEMTTESSSESGRRVSAPLQCGKCHRVIRQSYFMRHLRTCAAAKTDAGEERSPETLKKFKKSQYDSAVEKMKRHRLQFAIERETIVACEEADKRKLLSLEEKSILQDARDLELDFSGKTWEEIKSEEPSQKECKETKQYASEHEAENGINIFDLIEDYKEKRHTLLFGHAQNTAKNYSYSMKMILRFMIKRYYRDKQQSSPAKDYYPERAFKAGFVVNAIEDMFEKKVTDVVKLKTILIVLSHIVCLMDSYIRTATDEQPCMLKKTTRQDLEDISKTLLKRAGTVEKKVRTHKQERLVVKNKRELMFENVEAYREHAETKKIVDALDRMDEKFKFEAGIKGRNMHNLMQGYLINQILFQSFHRVGVPMNLTVEEFEAAQRYDFVHSFSVAKHKTFRTYGPMHVVLADADYDRMVKFLKYARPQNPKFAETDPTVDGTFFISWPGGKALNHKHMENRMRTIWKRSGPAKQLEKLGSTMIRTMVSSYVRKYFPQLSKPLAWQMGHTEGVARSNYSGTYKGELAREFAVRLMNITGLNSGNPVASQHPGMMEALMRNVGTAMKFFKTVPADEQELARKEKRLPRLELLDENRLKERIAKKIRKSADKEEVADEATGPELVLSLERIKLSEETESLLKTAANRRRSPDSSARPRPGADETPSGRRRRSGTDEAPTGDTTTSSESSDSAEEEEKEEDVEIAEEEEDKLEEDEVETADVVAPDDQLTVDIKDFLFHKFQPMGFYVAPSSRSFEARFNRITKGKARPANFTAGQAHYVLKRLVLSNRTRLYTHREFTKTEKSQLLKKFRGINKSDLTNLVRVEETLAEDASMFDLLKFPPAIVMNQVISSVKFPKPLSPKEKSTKMCRNLNAWLFPLEAFARPPSREFFDETLRQYEIPVDYVDRDECFEFLAKMISKVTASKPLKALSKEDIGKLEAILSDEKGGSGGGKIDRARFERTIDRGDEKFRFLYTYDKKAVLDELECLQSPSPKPKKFENETTTGDSGGSGTPDASTTMDSESCDSDAMQTTVDELENLRAAKKETTSATTGATTAEEELEEEEMETEGTEAEGTKAEGTKVEAEGTEEEETEEDEMECATDDGGDMTVDNSPTSRSTCTASETSTDQSENIAITGDVSRTKGKESRDCASTSDGGGTDTCLTGTATHSDGDDDEHPPLKQLVFDKLRAKRFCTRPNKMHILYMIEELPAETDLEKQGRDMLKGNIAEVCEIIAELFPEGRNVRDYTGDGTPKEYDPVKEIMYHYIIKPYLADNPKASSVPAAKIDEAIEKNGETAPLLFYPRLGLRNQVRTHAQRIQRHRKNGGKRQTNLAPKLTPKKSRKC